MLEECPEVVPPSSTRSREPWRAPGRVAFAVRRSGSVPRPPSLPAWLSTPPAGPTPDPHPNPMRSTTLLTLALALPLLACNGDPVDPLQAAETALQAGESRTAIELLERHLPSLDRGSVDHREATILLCRALAEQRPVESKDAFLALAAAQPDSVGPKEFKDVQSYLQTYGHFSEAIDVMDAGLKRWPGDETMLKVKDVLIAAVQSAGDAEATAKLKGLGYL